MFIVFKGKQHLFNRRWVTVVVLVSQARLSLVGREGPFLGIAWQPDLEIIEYVSSWVVRGLASLINPNLCGRISGAPAWVGVSGGCGRESAGQVGPSCWSFLIRVPLSPPGTQQL